MRAKDLVCPVILGRCFLKANQFIIDHDTLSCTSKLYGYNLLNKLTPTPIAETSKPETSSQAPLFAEQHTNILSKLLHCTKIAKKKLDGGAEEQQLQTTIAAIKTQVEVLANGEQLKCLNEEMCKRFKDHFPEELPLKEDIPTNVYRWFKLQDSNKLIAWRQYSCPWKH